MTSSDYDLHEAHDRDHDYWVSHRDDEDADRIRAWTAEDDDWTLIIEEGAPDAAIDAAKATSGFNSVTTTDDPAVDAERVKQVDLDVCERVTFYLSEPPEDRYHDVHRDAAIEMMARRDLWGETHKHLDSWYYPDRDEAVVQYQQNGTRRSISVLDSLDDGDRAILAGDYTDEKEARRSIEEVAELVYEESPLGQREAEILAHYIDGTSSHAGMADEMPVSRGSIASSAYALEDKLDGWVWLAVNILSNVPKDQLDDHLQDAVGALPSGDPYTFDERDVGDDTTLR